MSTVLIQLAPITETPTFSSRESTFITTRLPVEDMSPELFSWISNQEQWTPLDQVLSVNFSDQTTSFSDSLELETTGPRVTTPRELSSLIQFLTLSERRLKAATACKVSRLLTRLEVVPAQVWEPS